MVKKVGKSLRSVKNFVIQCMGTFLNQRRHCCLCLWLFERKWMNHLQSEGSLIDWIKSLDRAQTERKLNKITVIYSSCNGNLSGDSGAADLSSAIQIWAFCTPSPSAGKLLMHYGCNGSINLPTPRFPISALAACQDSDSSGSALWFSNAWACLFTSSTGYVSRQQNGHFCCSLPKTLTVSQVRLRQRS